MIKSAKYICVVLFLIIQYSNLVAQSSTSKKVPNLTTFDEKPVHFGFIIGFNTMNFTIHHSGYYDADAATPDVGDDVPMYTEVLDLTPGINLGIVSSFRLRKNLNLRILPGISFGQRNLTYTYNDGNRNTEIDNPIVNATSNRDINEPLKIKSTFIEMPILLKYGSDRMHNIKPYVVAGINPRFDLAKNKQDRMLLRNMDLYYEFGVGFDSYLNFFRLSTELKISIGMADVLNHDGTGDAVDYRYTQSIDKLTSRIFVLSFFFE
ncbi:outer membrane beta-barrel protein [Plebeiibacterium marinum]|uniref:PorT family protein n=1 Tax=Plebeiibacterium marinum TaxID=2992111 RepID=A0AAE3SHZ7_9BACT|nr:outer membrane beta-barrel protein [Plebeiobacterium marinum]MCW3804112.1 PorT family protein [Plebeiobacterium marinum]